MAIELIAKIKQKNGGDFFLVDAEDVELNGKPISDYIGVALTQEEYDELLANGKLVSTTQYFIYEDVAE